MWCSIRRNSKRGAGLCSLGAVASLMLWASTATATDAAISAEEMQRVYEEVKTPFKYGIVVRPGDGELVDCPSVFRFGGKWFMVYVAAKDKIGYQTFLAESTDLLSWKAL